MSAALESLPRAELAALGREYLLAGHLVDRAGMPAVVAEHGRDAMRDVAIDEWMGASPVYTRRIQRALGFGGDDVATIFKGMQFDIGAPHEFMDFRYEVRDPRHGEFRLASCGALMDVEPLGDDFVVAVCHHIEDPTFDATACATNPRARMRPVHRPPRVPSDRHPHCHWTVDIDPDAEPLEEPAAARRLATSRAAVVVLAPPPAPSGEGDDEGASDYCGPLDPDLRLEAFSRPTLVLLLQEMCLQGHLLARSFMGAVERRWGREAATRMGATQLTGIAGLTAKRLARFLGAGGGVSGVARVLDLHPLFHPRAYVDVAVELDGERVTVAVRPCDALAEDDRLTWPALLVDGHSAAVDAVVHAVDPRARCVRVDPRDGVVAAWSIEVDADAPSAPEASEVVVASFSTGADFRFAEP